MIRKYITLSVLILLSASSLMAQRGKHGSLTVTTTNVRINEFTTLTANAAANAQTISVANSNLNANARFASNLQVGDLIMIIQMQGASIKTFTDVASQDSTYGQILNYNGAGNHEFAQVFAIPNATSIVLDCGLTHSYTTVGRTQIIRIPRYTALTVNAGASITTDAWNGTIGGILAAEVNGVTTINGTVTATGLGFRGGVAVNNGNYGGGRFVDLGGGINEGGEKGESIAGTVADYIALYGGGYAKGAPANGGGGGNPHNCGGGGGANAGNINSYTGQGVLNPAYAPTYSLEFPGRQNIVSSGGGKGGYAFSSNNQNPLTTGPGNTAWGGDNRRNHGGFGGRPLNYTSGKIYFGGGGGAGHVNNISASNTGGTGGNGGGIIYLMSYGNITGTGVIISNGNNGVTATGPNPGAFSSNVNGNDSGGGGGGGGTILLATTTNVSGVTITANGGNGGNQIIVKGGFAGSNTEAEGPGGGGGGGYIAISGGSPTQNVLGAISGTTNATPMANFPTNGASNGGNGLSNQDVKLYTVDVTNATVCINSSASFTANTSNPLVSGFKWYTSIAGTTQIGTGAVFTTSVFTTPGTYTFYVGACPGVYRVPAIVTVNNTPTITANTASICGSQSATLTASGATSYTWSTGSTSASIVVNPTTTTVYTVTGMSGCLAQTTTTVFVQSLPSVSLVSTPSIICNNQSVTINANGTAGTYSWSTGASNTSSISVNTSGLYSVSVSNSCGSATSAITIAEGPAVSLGLSASSNTICSGGSVTLTASGTGTFAWSTFTVTTSTLTVNSSGIYFVTLSNQCGVTSSSIAINNGVAPDVGIVPSASAFCSGQPAVLTVTGSATSYTWSNGNTSSSISTTVAGNYSVVASNSCGVAASAITVTFQNSPDVSVSSNKTFLCPGDSALLTGFNLSGGGNYTWSSSVNTFSTEKVYAGGVYTVSYVNGCGIASATVSVRQSTLVPDFVVTPTLGTAPVTASFVNTSSSNANNSWNFGNGQTSTNVDDQSVYSSPGIYTITLQIQNNDGCVALVSKTLQVVSDIPVTPPLGLIPQLITPNNDGKNETFEIKGISVYPNNDLEIFNRWGNLVFSIKGYNNTFDGTPNHKSGSDGKLPSGTYFFILKLNDSANTVFKGYVELMY